MGEDGRDNGEEAANPATFLLRVGCTLRGASASASGF
jgi:hypothetical protein